MKIIANVGKSDSGLPKGWAQASTFYTEQLLEYLENTDLKLIRLSLIENIRPYWESNPGLHPTEQEQLIEGLLNYNKDITLEFTTHSPYILDPLEPSQVKVWFQGTSKLLSEHPNAQWNSNILTTGELWSAEGEEWISDPDA